MTNTGRQRRKDSEIKQREGGRLYDLRPRALAIGSPRIVCASVAPGTRDMVVGEVGDHTWYRSIQISTGKTLPTSESVDRYYPCFRNRNLYQIFQGSTPDRRLHRAAIQDRTAHRF